MRNGRFKLTGSLEIHLAKIRDTKEWVDPGSNNTCASYEQTMMIPVTTALDAYASCRVRAYTLAYPRSADCCPLPPDPLPAPPLPAKEGAPLIDAVTV